MTKTKYAMPPKPGACRVYKLVPVTEEDALAYAQSHIASRGWQPLDTGANFHSQAGGYIMVEFWAIPPAKEEG